MRRQQNLQILSFAFVATLLASCAHAPPAPPGPLRGPGVQGSFDFHFTVAPAKLAVTAPDAIFRGQAGGFGGGPPPIPHRLGARIAGAHWFDLGYDISFLDMGADLRIGQSLELSSVPWAIAVAGRTGAWMPGRERGLLDDAYELRVRAELYPPLKQKEASLLAGIFSVGLSIGDRFAVVETGEYDNSVSSGPNVLWRDVRLEATLGLSSDDLRTGRTVAIQYGAMPYVTLVAPRVLDCSVCDGAASAHLQQNYGVVAFLKFAFFVPFSRVR